MLVGQEEMARAQMVILHGHQLAANHHYALALIVQRCNELRHLCDVVTAAVRAKRASLTRARDLLRRLEAVRTRRRPGAWGRGSAVVFARRPFAGATKAPTFWPVRWWTGSRPKRAPRRPCRA